MGSRVRIRLEPFPLMSKSSMFSQIPQKILSQGGIAALCNNCTISIVFKPMATLIPWPWESKNDSRIATGIIN